ncbi:MAG: ketopantoate reductase family protein [Proteobacteria bacterium]|nr:ketopantoate reductase family protein [Pseudomonadota bacterium]
MIISIIGSGALGKAYGGLLSFKHEVHFLMHSEYQTLLQQKAFTLHFPENKEILIKDPLIHQAANTLPPSDVIIIALKTTENNQLGTLLASCLKPDSIILIIQNGIGNEEWVSQFSKNCPIVCGISSMGAFREGLDVQIPIIGEFRLAPYNASMACNTIMEAFNDLPIPIKPKIFSSYKEIRWRKLLWNVPFSSLSVIYKQDTQILASVQPYASIVRSLMNEIVDLAKAEGVNITQDDVEKMITLTKGFNSYYPSMYRDYFAGKPVEKEYIIGNVLKFSEKHHIDTPILKMIAAHFEI